MKRETPSIGKKDRSEIASFDIYIFIFAAFLLWVICFRDFLFGKLVLLADAVPYYENVKFFLDHFLRGIYPLWDPTRDGGVPNELFLRRIGEFNPFYLVIVLFQALGVPYTPSYLLFLAVYYFVGLIGFYKLAELILKNRLSAFVAFALLLFSSPSLLLFRSFIVLIFVPSVWFFYFMISFARTKAPYAFLGLCFTLSLILTTYIPFYFFTIFLWFVVLYVAIYPRTTQDFLKTLWEFIKGHKILVAFGLSVVLLSVIPGLSFYQASRSGDLILPERHSLMSSPDLLTLKPQTNELGGASIPVLLGRSTHGFFTSSLEGWYIPVFVYVLLLLGFFTRVNKRFVLYCLWGWGVYLLSLYDATGVYPFLFDHVFYFKYFRNFQFFQWVFLVPLFILMCVEQFDDFLGKYSEMNKEKLKIVIGAILVFLSVVLYWQGERSWTIYATSVFSWIFLVGYISISSSSRKDRPSGKVLLGIVLLIVAIEPFQVFGQYQSRAPLKRQAYSYEDDHYRRFLDSQEAQLTWKDLSPLAEKKHSVNPWGYYLVTRWFYNLANHIHPEILEQYRNFKFIVYDRVERVRGDQPDYKKLAKRLANNANVCMVAHDGTDQEIEMGTKPVKTTAQLITENGPEFQVLNYDVNTVRLQTHFSSPKFLVYNDSYDPDWHVYLNGKERKLSRANVAFKGVYLPAGDQLIEFRYGSAGRIFLGYFLVGLFSFTLVFLSVLWRRSFKGRKI